MKKYKFEDLDNEGYEIEVPTEVVKDILLDYFKNTYYWTVGLLSFVIGILLGVLIS